MDADKINRWLTLGANIGVLIGLFLLIVEIAQNNDAIQAQTRSDISGQIVDFTGMMASDMQMVSLIRRADAGEELSADEAAQYRLLLIANIRIWENIHYQYRNGMFDEQEFDSERNAWRFLINQNPVFVDYWCSSKDFFSAEFTAEIDDLFEADACALSGTRTEE